MKKVDPKIYLKNLELLNPLKTFSVPRKYGSAIAIVDNFHGSKAMLFISGQDGSYANSDLSEFAKMPDPNDPSTFTFHLMEDTNLKLNSFFSPIAEMESSIIAVHTLDKKLYNWDKDTNNFKEMTGKSITKVQEKASAWFKTTTRWEGTTCNKQPNKFSYQFDSCLSAFKNGLLLSDPGQTISIYLDTGSVAECSAEDAYSTGSKCPDGWYGKKGEGKCLMFHTAPEDNVNAARQCYREGSDLFQDEDETWNNILIDATYFSSKYSMPVYPGYIHLGLHQKQAGNNFLYHRNGVRVAHTYEYPSSLLEKDRKRICIAMSTLHSKDFSHTTRHTLTDVDCDQKGKFACTYNPDFMGFHFLSNINYEAIIDVTLDSMTATTCLSYCKASNELSVIAILLKKRCICSKGSPSYSSPKFEIKNKFSGKVMTAPTIDDEITETDSTGDDSQKWKWTNNGRLESIKHAGNVISLSGDSPIVKLVAEDANDQNQILVLDGGRLLNQYSNKILNINEGKIRSHWDQNGADLWILDYSGNDGGSNAFEQLTFDKMRPIGAWPFDCEKLIGCNNFEGQTCGCSNEDGSNEKAIMYFLGTNSKMSEKLNFKSCEDLKDHGVIYDGYFKINSVSAYCKNSWDADCGRGFKKIESACVNISSEAVASTEVTSKCAEIGAVPLITDSSAMFYQLKAYARNLIQSDDLWSDFKDGSSATDYQNSNSVTLSALNMGTEIWVASESFNNPCTVMAGGSDQYKLKSVSCSSQAKFACVKSLCPNGASLFAGKKCIKLVTNAATKTDAENSCKSDSSRLLSIMNRYEQTELEQFLQSNSITDDIHLGATKTDGQWLWSDESPMFVALSDKTTEVSVTTSQVLWNKPAENAVNGMIYDWEYAGIYSQHWLTITLPEVLWIRGVRAYAGLFSTDYFKWIDVRIGEDSPGSNPSNVNKRCTQYGNQATQYTEVYLKCPHPGLKGNIVTFHATSYHVGTLEIEVFDCPNGFFPLNNKCFKWLQENTLIKQQKKCDLYRGKLLDTSPHLTKNVLLALKIMTDYSADTIFSGVSQLVNGSYVNDMSYSERKLTLQSNIETFLDEYGVLSKINSGSNGFDYFPTYASPKTKHPAICEHFEEITFTNWGISNNEFEPIDGKDCAKLCSSADCDYTWRGIDCSESLQYICETDLKCPEGWVSFENSCYMLEKTKFRNLPSAETHCMMSHDSNVVVPNSNEEAAFISDYINAKASTETYDLLGLNEVIIGARQTRQNTYIEYADGTFMTNGTFQGSADTAFTNGYSINVFQDCISLTKDGGISKCSEANIFCEKNLIDDAFACMTASNLDSALTVNQSTSLTIWNQTPQKCIEYCRGLGAADYTKANLYAIVYASKCVCGTGTLDTSKEEKLTLCSRNDEKSFQGASDDSTVAIFNAGYGIRDYGEHVAPDTCWVYSHQLMYGVEDGITRLNLHFEPGRTILLNVDCSYSSPFCEKPLLRKKTNVPVFSGSILKYPERAPYKQSYSYYFAYIDTYKSGYYHSTYGTNICGHSSKCYTYYCNNCQELQVHNDKGFTIKFNQPQLITGVWWSASYQTNRYGWITRIGRVTFKMNGNSYSGNYLGNYVRTYDGGADDIGSTIARLNQPAYTDEITFTEIYYKASQMYAYYGHYVAFNFEVYGCDKFQMDEILCPDGWYSSKGFCIKAIEHSDTMTYSQAKEKCNTIGGFVLDPYNEMTMNDAKYVLTELLNNTDKKFWIGVHYATNTFRSKDMWQFENGVPIYEFQFPYWAERY